MPFPTLSFLIENVLVAILMIVYLAYEIRYGKGAEFFTKLEGVVEVVVAIAREQDGISEREVAKRLNGDDPGRFQIKDDDRD